MKIITENNIIKYIDKPLKDGVVIIGNRKTDATLQNPIQYEVPSIPKYCESNNWTYDGVKFECINPVNVIAAKIQAIKAEANHRILEIAPEWKQRNMLARGLELQNIGPVNWTEEQQAEVTAMRQIWADIRTIRERSNELEEQVKADPLINWEW